jgi:Flp pilus assembly protein TadG
MSKKGRLRRAQALVEFALLTPAFFMVLLGALDFGRVGYYYVSASSLARQAARYAAAFDNGTGWGSSGAYALIDVQSEAQTIPLSQPAGCSTTVPVAGSLTACQTPPIGKAYLFIHDVPAAGTVPHYVQVTVVYGFRPTTPMISAITGTIYVVATSSMNTEYV